MSEKKPGMSGGVAAALVALLIAIFAFSFSMAPKPGADEESFAGSDSAVTELLEDKGVEPWFSPIFEPGSGEIESGLFAVQAALGAGVFGFALGNLRGRAHRTRRESEAVTPSDAPTPLDA